MTIDPKDKKSLSDVRMARAYEFLILHSAFRTRSIRVHAVFIRGNRLIRFFRSYLRPILYPVHSTFGVYVFIRDPRPKIHLYIGLIFP